MSSCESVGPTGLADPAKPAKHQMMRSCVLCQSRKVRCDRQTPCGSCTKSRIECVYASVSPPKRRKKRFPEAELLARLKRYEDELSSYGAEIDDINHEVVSTAGDVPTIKVQGSQEYLPTLDPVKSFSVRGSLKRVENNLPANVIGEFGEAEKILQGSSDDELFEKPIYHSMTFGGDEGDVLFPSHVIEELSTLHPPAVHIFRLWQTYLDNVNPLIKVLHAPTVQQQILVATSDLEKIPNGLEALMFSIYVLAVISLGEKDCKAMLGEGKATLLARYRAGAKQALQKAGFLKSSELVVLQAFFLFLLSNLDFAVDPRSLSCLTGITVRIAQRMGLNSDGTCFGLSPFETEMRRRLWWQIIILDSRTAEVSGSGPSVMHRIWTTKLPTNINDSDLYQDMREPPLEHPRSTEMTFTLQRCELFQFFLQSRKMSESPALGDEVIDELEARIEQKYLRYCDPSVPIHSMSTSMARFIIDKLKMCPRQPHVLKNRGLVMSAEEKENLFVYSLKMLENHNEMTGSEHLRGFLWYINAEFPFPAHLYVLCALRSRAPDDLAERAWRALAGIYHHRLQQESAEKPDRLMHPTIAKLAIKAWEARKVASQAHSLATSPPSFISKMRSSLGLRPSQSSDLERQHLFNTAPDIGPGGHNATAYQWPDQSSAEIQRQSFDQTVMAGMQSSDWSLAGWEFWNDITQDPMAMQSFDAT